jgi:hypothetical protein
MAELGLPVVLNAGTVGSLLIDIPVTSLRAKPVRVMISDVQTICHISHKYPQRNSGKWKASDAISLPLFAGPAQIGRASCRERVY